MLRDIPNILTILRMVLIPVLVVVFFFEEKTARYISTGIFIFACITDYFDGAIARLFCAKTNIGRMLDPIADKMLIASILVLLVDKHMVPIVPTIAILCREILVSGMREYLATIRVDLHVSFLSKAKTALQMASIIIILLGDNSGIKNPQRVGCIALWITAILTVLTGYTYLREGLRRMYTNDEILKNDKKKEIYTNTKHIDDWENYNNDAMQ